MTLDRTRILEELSRRKADLAARFAAVRIGLFGSFARDEATDRSDIDLLVEFDPPTFDHYMDLKFDLEARFERTVDVVTPAAIKPRTRAAIERDIIYV